MLPSAVAQVWAYSTRYYEPDMVQQENVPGFPLTALREIFCTASELTVKPLETREVSDLERSRGGGPRVYDLRSKVFSPTDLGIPSSRGRQFACMILQPFLRFEEKSLTFEDLMFRRLRVTAALYLDSVPEELSRIEQFDLAAATSRRYGCSFDDVVAEDFGVGRS